MLNKITYTRLGAMASMIQIPASENILEVLRDEISKEIMEGYSTHDQRAFSTYIYLENAYLGCLRYSQDHKYGDAIRLKMYNQQSDSTRNFTKEVSAMAGAEVEPLFVCGDDTYGEKLDMFLEVWFSNHFRISGSDKYRHPEVHNLLPGPFIIPGATNHLDRFIEVLDDAADTDFEVDAVMPFITEDGDNEFTAVLCPGGGGEIWKCISLPYYSKSGTVKKPGLWRLVFTWTDYNMGEMHYPRTEEILNGVLDSSLVYSYVNMLPAPPYR